MLDLIDPYSVSTGQSMKEATSAVGAAAAAALLALWGWRKKKVSRKQKRDRVVRNA